MQKIFSKIYDGQRLSASEALTIYMSAPLAVLMSAAHNVRQRFHPQNTVTWQIDRNVNITNVCVSGCKFCNFHCKIHQTDRAYITTMEQYRTKIDQMLALGGDQLLLQGGMHPRLGLDFYEDLFSSLKSEYPSVKLHALGPPEVAYLADKAGISDEQVLRRLVDAGLESLPGAGAEILDSDVRRLVSPNKCSAERWLSVMGVAHRMGLLTSATMMYGHVESPSHRVDHLIKLRDLQDSRPADTIGFMAFIAWPFQGVGTVLEREGFGGGSNMVEYLRLVALARLVLDNVPNIQASWLTVGVAAAQMALHGGANDMGSIMIEENVVSAAGSYNVLDADGMQLAIQGAGFVPVQRNQSYESVGEK